MDVNNFDKREELLETCRDLRLAVSGNEKVETLKNFIQAAYDDYQEESNSSLSSNLYESSYFDEDNIDYGRIGDKSWRIKYFLNKILFFL